MDGGKWDGSEDARKTLLRQAIVGRLRLGRSGDRRRRQHPALRHRSPHRQLPQLQGDARPTWRRSISACAAGRRRAQDRRHRPAARRQPARAVADPQGVPSRPSPSACATWAFPAASCRPSSAPPFTYAAFNKERLSVLGMPSLAEVKQHLSLPHDQRRHRGVRRHRRSGRAQPQPADPQPGLSQASASTPSTCRFACRARRWPTSCAASTRFP